MAQLIAVMVRMSSTPGLTPIQGLGLLRAFLHEAVFRRSRERLAILADGFGRARVHLAFFYEASFRRTGQRLAFLADRLGLTGLSHRTPDGKRRNQSGKKNAFHYFLHSFSARLEILAVAATIATPLQAARCETPEIA
jgi:hypothetical protein